MKYRIYPSVGIARLGDSDEFFIGPEVTGSRGRELDTSAEVTRFKDAQFRIRKHVARFHLFQQSDDNAPLSRAVLPDGAIIDWTVHLANKKDAIFRPSSPPGPILSGQKLRPKADPNRAARLISAGDSISSDAGTSSRKPLQGAHVGNPVTLGELRVDGQGRLLVFGGALISKSHPNTPTTGDFYNNPNWHDDVSDGPVTAQIRFPDGHAEAAEPAWVVVTPPDFAPGADPIVTLFDEILQLAIDSHWDSPWTRLANTPSFTQDIWPILRRARSLGWVHVDVNQLPGVVTNEKNWEQISQDFVQLGTAGSQTQQLRSGTRDLITNVTSLLSDYSIPAWQVTYLDAWVNGNFTPDWNGPPPIAVDPTADSLTRIALQGAVGQGFFPGIEAGRITTDPTIYRLPFDFRIAGELEAGDLTAFMAQPWQADFLKCSGNWWPSQRPDLSPQKDGTFALWQRPVTESQHEKLIELIKRFGMITVTIDSKGVQVSAAEQGRDPAI